MKYTHFLFVFISLLLLTSCSSKNDIQGGNQPIFKARLLKQVTNSDGFWQKFFYNDKKQIELLTQTSNQIDLDSTYFFYNGDMLTRTLQRTYVPNTGVINTDINYDNFSDTQATGSYKIYKDDGTVFQNQTFEYTFLNNLIKSIIFYNLDGTKSSEKIYNHDVTGNLTKWTEIWYGSNNAISSSREHTFSKWDDSGLKTQSLLYWNYRIYNIPNMFISNSNLIDRTENGQTYNYTFEYDPYGNVIKYTSVDEQKYITLEYYQ
ncbi:hypothetical protein [Gaetbulibacter aestuarii]|uniref:YD repeat-containing protein n=1 Tax=Gaetbulibacter aestuarii TaxID=1502358 RepID=A0ABW7MZX3_9FLAO